MYFNREFIKSVVSEVVFQGVEFPTEVFFNIDSRTLQKGALFVALKGVRVDGHDFVMHAIERGASGLIINQSQQDCLQKIKTQTRQRLAIALVPDTQSALKALA